MITCGGKVTTISSTYISLTSFSGQWNVDITPEIIFPEIEQMSHAHLQGGAYGSDALLL